MQIRPLAGPIGAEITGLDLSRPLSTLDGALLRSAWTTYRLLLLRDQSIDNAAHARFAAIHGTALIFGDPASPIYESANVDAAGQLLSPDDERAALLRMNWHWHTDGCYRAHPNRGVILRAVEAPLNGGETEFADLKAAYACLPSALRKSIDGMICLHSFAHMISECQLSPVQRHENLPRARHPLVWRHGVAGASLFLSPPYMAQVDGLSAASTRELVEELTAHATQPRHILRHQWRPNDVLLWDNHWTMHRVRPYDLGRERRVMRGATLAGTEPVVGHAEVATKTPVSSLHPDKRYSTVA